MEAFTGPEATLWGTFYPKGYVVAVVDDPQAAQRAFEALQNAGWAGEEARLWTGEQVLAKHQQFMEHRSLAQRVGASIGSGSPEDVALKRYLEQARHGHLFLTVHAPNSNQVEQIHGILDDYNAHTIKYYAAAGVADVHP